MNQLALFDPPRARKRDPETSHKAAGRVGEFQMDHYARILEALDRGPATIYQLADRTGLTHVQVARRTTELETKGLIATLPEETRLSPSGRSCRVWKAL